MKVKRIEVNLNNLCKKMIRLYEERRKKKAGTGRIVRGRQESVSSEFELGVARILKISTPKKYRILLDCPLSFGGKQPIYPDLTLLDADANRIVAFLEIKIDLGFCSPRWGKMRSKQFEKLKKQESLSTKILGADKISVKKRAKLALILLTAKNDHNRLPEIKKGMDVFPLLSGVHPNSRKVISKDALALDATAIREAARYIAKILL